MRTQKNLLTRESNATPVKSGYGSYIILVLLFTGLLISNNSVQAQGPQPVLEWAKGFGSSSLGWAYGITTDNSGNVYTTGFFSGTTDFDPGSGVFNLTSSGGYDIYISKLDASGNFVWAVKMGGTADDIGLGIALDPSGNVYTTGQFKGTTDLDPGAPVFALTSAGGYDVYISKLDSDGNFIWAKSIGGSSISGDFSNALAVDDSGNVYYGGYFYGTTNFDPNGTLNLTSTGSADIFVSKLDNNGSLVWVKTMGGTGIDLMADLALDASGNIYSTGFFEATADLDPGAGTAPLTATGSQDVFVSKLDNNGNFIFAKKMGGTDDDYGSAINLDNSGNILVSGFFNLTGDFDPGSGISNLTSHGLRDAFITKLDNAGGFIWAKGVGGLDDEGANSILADDLGNVYVTGSFSKTADFDPGSGTFNLTSVTPSPTDIFVLKLDVSGNFGWAVAMGGTSSDAGIVLSLADEDVYVAGYFQGTADFDPGIGTFNLTSPAAYSAYVMKLVPAVAPTITDFFPGAGPFGTEVTILGTNFNGATNVYFGTSPATFIIDSPTQIRATVPAGATFAPITVTKGGLTAYSFEPFVITFPDGGVMTGCAFSTPALYSPTQTGTYGIAIGDLDKDGKTDLVSVNASSSFLSILRNLGSSNALGSPRPSFAPKIDIATSLGSPDVALGDIDGDGKLDMVVVNASASTISIYRNTTSAAGAITFASQIDFATGTNPNTIAIQDLDGDGKPDIVVVNQSDFSISVLRNISSQGSLSMNPQVSFATGTFPGDVKIADIDGDDKPDILVVNQLDHNFSVLRNTSSTGIIDATSFAPRVDFATGSASAVPFAIAVGDMDLDGDHDVVVANLVDNSVAVFRNSSIAGTISFAPHADFVTGDLPFDIKVADLDGDGKLDVAVTVQDAANPGIQTVKNATVTSGSFVFNSFQLFPTTTQPYGLGIADFDNDGKPDMAAADFSADAIAVFRNQVSSLSTLAAVNYSPASGPVGTVVTITGGPFSATPSNNIVYFNSAQANVFSASPTSLTVTVPPGATTGFLTVTVGCQTAGNIVPFTVTAGSCLPISQRNALINLYNDTNGDDWTNKTNWLSANESTWFGVTVTGCTVTKLILPSNNLDGPLTNSSIGTLFDLTELDLSDNQLASQLPSSLDDLTNITKIVLNKNSFYGDIPSLETLGETGTPLTLLDLSQNELYGNLPIELRVVTSLKYLYLDHNGFDGEIPDEYKDLNNLEEFTLDYNGFTGNVPGSLITLTKLKKFSASNNELEVIDAALGALPIIQKLDFSFNELTSVPTFTSGTITRLMLEHNALEFGDLEQNIGVGGYTYTPQAKLPPGGTINFVAGSPLTIPFSTSGTGNSYQWYKRGVLIPGATSNNLTIPSTTINDAGFYSVRITSSVVPFITLESLDYLALTDPCSGTRTAGDNDASFDPHIDTPVTIYNVERQSTGKIIVSLNSSTTVNSVPVFDIIRFNTDGSLDNSFAPSGLFSPSRKNILVQPDDKILTTMPAGGGTQLVRLNADGSSDGAFNANTIAYYAGSIFSMGLQPDNKIVICHDIYLSGPYLERINADGTTDGSFVPAVDGYVYAIVIQPDGKILIGGDFGVMRLTSSGSTDVSFTADLNGEVNDIAIQPDGKIVISGAFTQSNGFQQVGIARLNNDGSNDNTFNVIGVTDDYSLGHQPYKISIQPDGKILFAGEFDNVNGANRKNIVRLNSDGSVDCSFDPLLSADQIILDMVLQPDGRILIVGDFSTYDGAIRHGLARINNGSATTITITLQPVDASVCPGTNAIFNTNATGAANLTYKWQYTTGTVYADINDNANYSGTNTKTLTIITTGSFGAGRYRCRVNGDLAAEKITIDKALTLLSIPKPIVTTSNCSSTSATLTGPAGFATYIWSTGASTQQIIATTAGNYMLMVTNSGGCISPWSDVITFDSNFCNAAPVIATSSAQTIIGGIVTINLLPLLSDPDNNLNMTTLKVKVQPSSGAPATINSSSQLKVDYTGVSFAGKDETTIEVCDFGGKCAQQKITIDVNGDIIVYTGISPNGDNLNDFWMIQFIESIPDTKNNKVSLFNRWGDNVFEVENYNNQDRVFKGIGKSGSELPSGVYFYKIEFTSGRPMMTGYLSVRY